MGRGDYRRAPTTRLPERIPAGDLRKAAKVFIQSQNLVNPVFERQRHEMGVVGEVAARGGSAHDLPENLVVDVCFRQDPYQRRPDEVAEGLHGIGDCRWWVEDAMVCHHTQEFI